MAYKTLDKLISEIQDELKKLEFGQLKIQDLDELVDHSKELHERLVVLRYKAYDHKIKSKQSLEGEIPLLFKMESKEEIQPEISPNQINLIDAIEDLDPPVEEKVVEEIVEEFAEEPIIEKVEEAREDIKPDPAQEQTEIKASASEASVKEIAKEEKVIPPPANSLFDDEDTLAEKLTKTPISSLKSVITLNQKFRFISALFGGDADEYNSTIQKLDEMSAYDQADTYLNDNIRNKYELTGDEAEIEIFMDLVQRRYL